MVNKAGGWAIDTPSKVLHMLFDAVDALVEITSHFFIAPRYVTKLFEEHCAGAVDRAWL